MQQSKKEQDLELFVKRIENLIEEVEKEKEHSGEDLESCGSSPKSKSLAQ